MRTATADGADSPLIVPANRPNVRETATGDALLISRFPTNTIIHRVLFASGDPDGANINGPCLVRVPAWVADPLGRYYCYFAHHQGASIRLAYADTLAEPWQLHPGGVFKLAELPAAPGHIAHRT